MNLCRSSKTKRGHRQETQEDRCVGKHLKRIKLNNVETNNEKHKLRYLWEQGNEPSRPHPF